MARATRASAATSGHVSRFSGLRYTEKQARRARTQRTSGASKRHRNLTRNTTLNGGRGRRCSCRIAERDRTTEWRFTAVSNYVQPSEIVNGELQREKPAIASGLLDSRKGSTSLTAIFFPCSAGLRHTVVSSHLKASTWSTSFLDMCLLKIALNSRSSTFVSSMHPSQNANSDGNGTRPSCVKAATDKAPVE